MVVVTSSTISSTTTERKEIIEKTEKVKNAEEEMKRKFVQKFSSGSSRGKAPIATDEDPVDPIHKASSQDSILSSGSRESVVSAASMKAESQIRRNFNY